MSRITPQANTWQTLDVEVTPEEGDFLNTDARAIISQSQSVANPLPDQEPQAEHNFASLPVASAATNSSSQRIQISSPQTVPGKQSPTDPVVNTSASQLVAGNTAPEDLANPNHVYNSSGLTRARFETQSESHHSLDREGESSRHNLQMPEAINLDHSGLRRSARIKDLQAKKLSRVFFSLFCAAAIASSVWSFTTQASTSVANSYVSLHAKTVDSYHRANSLYDGTINCFSSAILSAVASNEVFTYKEALKQEDAIEFVKAMVKEVRDHENKDNWTLIERKDMPSSTKTIMAIWSFKRKRFPDGSLNKHKARLCAHGGMQTWGENY